MEETRKSGGKKEPIRVNGRVDKFVHPMLHVNGDVVPRDAMVYGEWKKDEVAQPCGEIGAKSSDSDAS